MPSRLICRLLLALMSLAVAGCASRSASTAPSGEYRTITAAPRRDLDAAIKANQQGLEQLAKGQTAKAIEAFQAALTADVTFGPAHNNLGTIYYGQRDYYKAAWEFEYAIKLMPGQPQPRNNLGLVYEAVGKLDEAVASYDEAMKLDADNPQYIGNAARARARRGDRTPELRDLLSRLIMHDTRPEWVAWARQTLARLEAAPPRPS